MSDAISKLQRIKQCVIECPDEEFDMGEWRRLYSGCRTVRCAIGNWIHADGELTGLCFNELSFSSLYDSRHGIKTLDLRLNDYEAIECVLGIQLRHVEYMFSPATYPTESISKNNVVLRINKVIGYLSNKSRAPIVRYF